MPQYSLSMGQGAPAGADVTNVISGVYTSGACQSPGGCVVVAEQAASPAPAAAPTPLPTPATQQLPAPVVPQRAAAPEPVPQCNPITGCPPVDMQQYAQPVTGLFGSMPTYGEDAAVDPAAIFWARGMLGGLDALTPETARAAGGIASRNLGQSEYERMVAAGVDPRVANANAVAMGIQGQGLQGLLGDVSAAAYGTIMPAAQRAAENVTARGGPTTAGEAALLGAAPGTMVQIDGVMYQVDGYGGLMPVGFAADAMDSPLTVPFMVGDRLFNMVQDAQTAANKQAGVIAKANIDAGGRIAAETARGAASLRRQQMANDAAQRRKETPAPPRADAKDKSRTAP